MGRRGNNEGSIIHRKDGRWEARITLPDGSRKSFYGTTRQEVARKLTTAQHDLDKGLLLPNERQTLGQYLVSWLEIIKPRVGFSTWRRYDDYVRLHVTPALGRVALSKLTAQQIQMLCSQKLQEGLSPTTVRKMVIVLRQALKQAERLSLVQRNVAVLVSPPRPARKEMLTLSEEQAQHFLKTAAPDRFRALYILALTTGMREGELLGLRWQDVDLEKGFLQVRVGIQEARAQKDGKLIHSYILAEPKTASSRRRIPLSQMALVALQEHCKEQRRHRFALGPAWRSDLDLVFPNLLGGIMDPHYFQKRFYALLERAGLPRIRFHDLRHTAATLLLKRSVHPKIVSELLGHASIKITLDLYSHVIPDMQGVVTMVMDAIFASSAS